MEILTKGLSGLLVYFTPWLLERREVSVFSVSLSS
jgi:hypothetical protein